MKTDIHVLTRGRWRYLLPATGVPERILDGKHQACPMCGGKDRFRWDDKEGKGTYFCSGCGSGTGVDLVMQVNKVDFKGAVAMIREHLGDAPFEVKRPRRGADRHSSLALIDRVWKRSQPLTGFCAASKYLRSRGLTMTEWPRMVRFHPALPYYVKDQQPTKHPAMVALVVAPDRESVTLHYTYLTEDGEKADLDPPRKLAPATFPRGGAVRLAASMETMGIAEGIETALAAQLLHDIPVWAACTAGALAKWEPPENVKAVLIFGDNDPSYAGQAAAYALAYRLSRKGLHVETRFPDTTGDDWNDVLQSIQRGGGEEPLDYRPYRQA